MVRLYGGVDEEDHGGSAILPGLVNCHSHLEVTAMRNALDSVEHDFSTWLLRLTLIRAGFSDDDLHASALAGAAEGAAAGVTCFGDIGRFAGAGMQALKAVGLRGMVYQETEFYVEHATAAEDVSRLIEKFEHLRASETQLVAAGISPHSPYTVGPKQLELIARFAVERNVHLTLHTAESSDECELLDSGEGFFRQVYEKYGVEWQSPGCSPVEYLHRLGVLQARPLLAHCVNVSADDIELIAANGSSVAHCPKSNAKFGHGYAPFEQMLDAGISVGLGSDSVASNNTCDLFEEARFAALAARNRAGTRRMIAAEDALYLATLGGARALGLDTRVGSLEPGKQADLVVISLAHLAQRPVTDICAALVFASGARDVRRTMVSGRDIFKDGRLILCDEEEIKRRLEEIEIASK
jgi:5-methylthioadenosine/S-adenosylhomocysteine deaminase